MAPTLTQAIQHATKIAFASYRRDNPDLDEEIALKDVIDGVMKNIDSDPDLKEAVSVAAQEESETAFDQLVELIFDELPVVIALL